MKTFTKIFIVLIFLLFCKNIFAQTPTYKLKAMNFVYTASNVMEFEIRIEHTNSPIVFEYSGGQYFFNFNPAIANGGTLSYTYASDTSNLPVNLRPRNPQISGSQLRLAANIFPSAGNGFIMTNNGNPGTKVIRMKLATTASSFASVPLSFEWRNNSPDPFTKVYAYIGTTNTNISSSATYSIDSSGIIMRLNVKAALEGLYRAIQSRHSKKDSITSYLRNASAPYQIKDSGISILDSITLISSFTFRNTPSGLYYIVLKYKNCIETWSKAGGENIIVGTLYNYDFTTSASQAYGNNLIFKGNKFCIYSGDVNFNNFVDISDMSRIYNDASNYATGDVITDLNGDRAVDLDDLAIADNNVYNYVLTVRP